MATEAKHKAQIENERLFYKQQLKREYEINHAPMSNMKGLIDALKLELETTKAALDEALNRMSDKEEQLRLSTYELDNVKQKMKTLEYINTKN